MLYPKIKDYFEIIFNGVRSLAYDDVKKPNYEKDVKGMKELTGLLDRIQNNLYYPDFTKKAAYFFLALSTSHYFENGNKRIAIGSFAYFALINKYRFRSMKLGQYRLWFKKHFPKYVPSGKGFHRNFGWALYNFNIAINMKAESHEQGHSYDFNQLKDITESFIRLISRKK